MLVLSRKVGERIWIGDDILVEVVDVRSGKIMLGIVATKDVRVLRGELKNAGTTSIPPVSGGEAATGAIGGAGEDFSPSR